MGSKWMPLVVISLAIFIIMVDTTMMNVAISALVEDLNTTVSTIQGIIAIYALIMAAFMIFGGKLGDIHGRKKIFIIGVVIYGIGTTIAALSINATMLLIGWSIIEGFAAALMLPATAALILSIYQGKDRIFAFSVWGAMAAVAAAIGPMLGGYFTSFHTWRYGFAMEVAIVIVILALSVKLIESKAPGKLTIDWLGVVLAAIGFSVIVLGILQAGTYGFMSLQVLSPITAGIVVLGIFAWWQKKRKSKGKTPLIDLSIFKIKQFNTGMLSGALLVLNMAAILFIIPLFLQMVYGYSAFATGVILVPFSISILVLSLIIPKFSDRIPSHRIIQLGFILAAIGTFMLVLNTNLQMTGMDFFWPFVVMGCGFGMVLAQITNVTLSAVSPKMSGEVSGGNNTARQLANSLGVAMIGAVLIIAITSTAMQGVMDSPVFTDDEKDWLIENGQEIIDRLKAGEEFPDWIPQEKIDEFFRIIDEGALAGMTQSYIAIMILFIVGFISSLFLPKKMEEAK